MISILFHRLEETKALLTPCIFEHYLQNDQFEIIRSTIAAIWYLKLIHQLGAVISINYFWHWMPITGKEIYLNSV